MLKKNTCPLCKAEIEFPGGIFGRPEVCDRCKTIVYKTRWFTQDSLEQLKRRFRLFTVLSLFEIACLCTLLFSGSQQLDSYSYFVVDVFYLALLTYITLLVVYIQFLRSLQESSFLIVFCLFLFLLVPVLFFGGPDILYYSTYNRPFYFFIAVVLLDAFFRLFSGIRAACVLRFAAVFYEEGNKCSRMLKGYSFLLLPLFISLMLSIVCFGSGRTETGLCRNCGIWDETDSVCFLSIKLVSFPSYRQTAFSKYLDPEHLCRHSSGKRNISNDEYYLIRSVGYGRFAEKMFTNSPVIEILSDRNLKKREIRTYLDDYSNIKEKSSLYRYLCEKNSQPLARRMISLDLTSDEEDDFYRNLIKSANGDRLEPSPSVQGYGRE